MVSTPLLGEAFAGQKGSWELLSYLPTSHRLCDCNKTTALYKAKAGWQPLPLTEAWTSLPPKCSFGTNRKSEEWRQGGVEQRDKEEKKGRERAPRVSAQRSWTGQAPELHPSAGGPHRTPGADGNRNLERKCPEEEGMFPKTSQYSAKPE